MDWRLRDEWRQWIPVLQESAVYGLKWEELTPEERMLAEQAVLNFRALRRTCAEAPDGKVLAFAETLAVSQGREAIRKTLETALQLEAAEVEKRGAPAERANAAEPSGRTAAGSHGKSSRQEAR